MMDTIHYLAMVYSYKKDVTIPVLVGMAAEQTKENVIQIALSSLIEQGKIASGKNVYIHVQLLGPAMLGFFMKNTDLMSQGRKLTDGLEGVLEYILQNHAHFTDDGSMLLRAVDAIPKFSPDFRICCKETPAFLKEIIAVCHAFVGGMIRRSLPHDGSSISFSFKHLRIGRCFFCIVEKRS